MDALHAFLFHAVGSDNARYTLYLHRADAPDGSDAATHAARDAELIAQVRGGDARAFEAMYRANASTLAAFANGIVRAPDIAEELVNDVFVRMWDTRHTFAPSVGVRAYLYTAVRHRALNYVRGVRREEMRHHTFAADLLPEPNAETVPVDATAAREEEQEERIAAVRRIVATFPPGRRQVMELRWNDGLTNAEISAVLGLTDQAVRSHLSRALRDLRAAFPDLIG